jgi:hypothetical protein
VLVRTVSVILTLNRSLSPSISFVSNAD